MIGFPLSLLLSSSAMAASTALWIAAVSSVIPSPFALYGGRRTLKTPASGGTGKSTGVASLTEAAAPVRASVITSTTGICRKMLIKMFDFKAWQPLQPLKLAFASVMDMIVNVPRKKIFRANLSGFAKSFRVSMQRLKV